MPLPPPRSCAAPPHRPSCPVGAVKKIRRAVGRHEKKLAKRLDERRPVYKLDHLVRERYPSFADALQVAGSVRGWRAVRAVAVLSARVACCAHGQRAMRALQPLQLASQDLDDALCLTFLFASLASSKYVPAARIQNCKRLQREFQAREDTVTPLLFVTAVTAVTAVITLGKIPLHLSSSLGKPLSVPCETAIFPCEAACVPSLTSSVPWPRPTSCARAR